MTTCHLDDSEFQALKGKTIIITGAASGIGRAAVQIAHKHGANVAIADWNEAAGQALQAELNDPEHILFHRTDVSSWPSVLSLFDATVAALLLPVVRPEINGKSFYVAGNAIVEVEDKTHEAQPIWLGERLSRDVDEGQRRLIPLAPPL